ncbi:phospholipid-binding protein [Candidatus Endobugula sertula]|uniref:Phospholipid-binding protein n=1 Tax=Candidatus Endobugula sertula TaxID=62101 RepID=A0A1D2QTN9_9GAMM|nr:phospholipid-binding protein [Candidatus Endobugula sertula]
MKKAYIPILTITSILSISSCTTILDKTTSGPITTDPGERTFGTYIDDQRLEIIVGVNLKKADPALKTSHINVTSFNNIILLTGQVPTPQLIELATQTSNAVNMVRKVYNELQVKGNTAMLVRTNDTWISTKVKTAFIADKMIDSSKVKVTVEDSVVYLMGKLTQPEADYVSNVTSNIAGVQEVVRVFEYIH